MVDFEQNREKFSIPLLIEVELLDYFCARTRRAKWGRNPAPAADFGSSHLQLLDFRAKSRMTEIDSLIELGMRDYFCGWVRGAKWVRNSVSAADFSFIYL